MRESWRDLWRAIRFYDDIADISSIARRYFAMNAFDGVLTIIGVLMGTLAARVTDAQIVLTTGVATAVSMGVSGLWGAYLTESAERKRTLQALNRQTLTDLKDSRIGRANQLAVAIVALVDGISPLLAALLVLAPFFVADYFPKPVMAHYTALGLALALLFALGLYLGHISAENKWRFGLKTVVAGVISILISTLLNVAER